MSWKRSSFICCAACGACFIFCYGHVVLPGEQFGTIAEAEAIELFRRDLVFAEAAINQGNWALAKRELLRWVCADGKGRCWRGWWLGEKRSRHY